MTTEDLNQDLNQNLNKELTSGSANCEVLDLGREADCAKEANLTKQVARLNSYSDIADDIKKAIESNYYTTGSFPSSRALASRYGVSRSTILAAFGILVRQGLMTVSHGKTPQIINTNFSPNLSPGSQTKQRIAQDPDSGLSFAPNAQTHSETNSQTKQLTPMQQTEGTSTYEKLSSQVPARKWFALISNQARKAHNQGSLPNLDAMLELKLALRNYFARQRQIRANLDQIFIFENPAAALQALANIFAINAETEILIDAPCLASSVRQLSRFSNKIEAIDLETLLLSQAISQRTFTAGLLYTTPSTRLGSNRALNKASRQALVHWAQSNNRYIIEHDKGHEFCSGLSTNPAIFAVDQSSTTVYIADFNSSLSLLTNLCVVIVPPALAHLMRRNQHFEQSSSTIFESVALTTLLNSGYLERHARKIGQLCLQNLSELKRLLESNEKSRSIASLRLVKSSKEAILEVAPGVNCDFLAPAIATKLLTPTIKMFGFSQGEASTFMVAADFLNQTNHSLLHACFANRNSTDESNNQFYSDSLSAALVT